MARVLIKNLIYNNVACDLSIAEIVELQNNFNNLKQTYQKLQKYENDTFFIKGKNKKQKIEKLGPAPVVPETIKVGNLILSTKDFTLNSTQNLVISEISLDHFISNLEERRKDKQMYKIGTNHDGQIYFMDHTSKDKIKKTIKDYLKAFIDCEDFFSHRLNLWKENYVKAEALGEDELKKYLEVSPRPEQLSETFKVFGVKMDVFDFLRRPHMRMFGMPMHYIDLYMMDKMNFMRRRDQKDLSTNDSQNKINDEIVKAQNEAITQMRNELENMKLEIYNENEYLEIKYKQLNEKWNQLLVVEKKVETEVNN